MQRGFYLVSRIILLCGAASAALAATGGGAAFAQFVPPYTALIIDNPAPPADPVTVDSSKFYSSIIIGQNNPFQNAVVTGDTYFLTGLTLGQNATSGNNQLSVANGTLVNAGFTAIVVGDMGSGNLLSINAGTSTGFMSAAGLIIGKSAGADSNQVVIESDNILNSALGVYVGQSGASNTVTIANGGYLFSSAGVLGQMAGADGNAAIVTGTNSLWALGVDSSLLMIGDSGNNNLVQVTDGGTIALVNSLASESQQSTADIIIGNQGSGNQLYIANGGSVSHQGAIHIGENGSGNQLMLDTRGHLSSVSAVLGYGAAASGNTADIEFDALWDIDSNNGWLIVGLEGSGNLVNVNGGVIALSDTGAPVAQPSPDIIIGALAGGNSMSIGYSGYVSHPGAIYVGENGSGNQLNLYFNGMLETGGEAYIGGGPDYSAATFGGTRQAADNNIVTVDGTDSFWNIGGNLYVGAGFAPSSSGNQLNVQYGGRVSAGGDVFIGYDGISDGNLIAVSGLNGGGAPTSFTTPGTIRIGVSGEDVEAGLFSGNTLQAGSADAGEYYGTVEAARILVGSGNTLSVAGGGVVSTGDIVFGSGATYDVLVNSDAPGALNASGTATRSGTVAMSFGEQFDNRYVILASAASTGAFTLDTSNLSDGLSAQIEEVATGTGSETAITFVSNFAQNPALSGNELAVAAAIDDAFNSGSSISGELATMPAAPVAPASATASAMATPMGAPSPSLLRERVRQRLSGLAGEVGAGGGTQAVEQASRSFLALLSPSSGDGGQGGFVPRTASTSGTDARIWTSVFGADASLSGNEGQGSHDTGIDVSGIAGGGERRFSGGRLAGLAVAGGHTGWSVSRDRGAGESSFLQLGAYGLQEAGAAYVSGAAAVAFHSMSTDRNLTILRSHAYQADYSSEDAALRLEAGYRLLGEASAVNLTPYAAVEGQYIHTGGYGEDTTLGSGAFALSYDDSSTTSVRSEVGAGLDLTMPGPLPISFSARAAWAHDWNSCDDVQASFQTIENATFTVAGAEPPENLALVGGKLGAWVTDTLELSGAFTGEFGEGYENIAGAISLRHPL